MEQYIQSRDISSNRFLIGFRLDAIARIHHDFSRQVGAKRLVRLPALASETRSGRSVRRFRNFGFHGRTPARTRVSLTWRTIDRRSMNIREPVTIRNRSRHRGSRRLFAVIHTFLPCMRVCELSENRSGDGCLRSVPGNPPWHRESPEKSTRKKKNQTALRNFSPARRMYVHSRTIGRGSFSFLLSVYLNCATRKAETSTSAARACTPRFCVRWRVRVLSFRVNRREPSRDLRQCLSGHGLAPRTLRAASRAGLPFTSLALDVLRPSPLPDAFPTPSKNGFPHSAARRTSFPLLSAWRTSFGWLPHSTRQTRFVVCLRYAKGSLGFCLSRILGKFSSTFLFLIVRF